MSSGTHSPSLAGALLAHPISVTYRPNFSTSAKSAAVIASPIGVCYIALMTYNAILAIECLVEDFGWDAVMDVLMKEAATASDERLNEVEELLDAAITVNEGKGQLFVL